MPQTTAEISLSFAPVVRQVVPAVVNIYTRRVERVRVSPFMHDPIFREFFGGGGGLPRERISNSLGSGVIVKADGTLVTSYHVIKDSQEIRAVLSDRREFNARIIATDPQTDLAVLKLEGKTESFPYLAMRDSDSLEVGELVLAVGNPFGVGQTVTSGIISALARPARSVSDYQFFIQTDAAINPGNSGGALVDMQGRLVGINTAIFSTSGGSIGIGFAIPADMVQAVLAHGGRGGRVERPWLGVEVQEMTGSIAESLGLKTPQGVLVKEVAKDSPAEKAGIRVGDVIIAVQGHLINDEQSLNYRTAIAPRNTPLKIDLLRSGGALKVQAVLAAPPENIPRDVRILKGNHPLAGVEVANLSPALAVELDLDPGASGVIVLSVQNSPLVFGLGLEPGDIILDVNGVEVKTTAQLEKLMAQKTRGWKIRVQRGGALLTMVVQL